MCAAICSFDLVVVPWVRSFAMKCGCGVGGSVFGVCFWVMNMRFTMGCEVSLSESRGCVGCRGCCCGVGRCRCGVC